MTKVFRYRPIGFIIIVFALLPGIASPQAKKGTSDTSKQEIILPDSTILPPIDTIKAVNYDSTFATMVDKLRDLTVAVNKTNGFLRRGIDTTEISEELPRMESLVAYIRENMTIRSQQFNLRNLHAIKVILIQVSTKVDKWTTRLKIYNNTVNQLTAQLRTFTDDSSFRKVPTDTALYELYASQIRELSSEWVRADTLQKRSLAKISRLNTRVASINLTVKNLEDDLALLLEDIGQKIWEKEEKYLWELRQRDYPMSFLKVLSRTAVLGSRLFNFYSRLNTGILFLILVVGVLYLLWVRSNLKIYRSKNERKPNDIKYLSRSPLAATILFLFTIAPLILTFPPASYAEVTWVFLIASATYLSWEEWSPVFKKYWLRFMVLFVLYGIDSLMISSSLGERFYLVFMNGITIWLGVKMYREIIKEKERYPNFLDDVVFIMIIMNILSLVANLMGRFTIAKLLSNTSVVGVGLALAFYIDVDIIIESILLQFERHREKRIGSISFFKQERPRFRKFLMFLAILLWVVAFSWSLVLFNTFWQSIVDFLGAPREIGNFKFTFRSIIIFFLVIWISTMIAKLLSILFGKSADQFAGSRKGQVGSWVLLLRLGVMVSGFLLAVASAGIPLDKITIIIGALGVGIGFGLQNVVNNLLSGVILAFERPVQVGDIIEVGTRTGEVREIGIRSSRILTFEGSEIIIPNGDLTSSQLVNWTHSHSYRRIEALVGVAYGSSIEKVQEVVQKVLADETGVMKHPPPLVLVSDFSASSVDFKIYFWVGKFENWVTLRSMVMGKIYDALNKNQINIPFPQQDLHIKSIDPSVLNSLGSKKEEGREGPPETSS